MRKRILGKRVISFILAMVMILGDALPTYASEVTETGESTVTETVMEEPDTSNDSNQGIAVASEEVPEMSSSTVSDEGIMTAAADGFITNREGNWIAIKNGQISHTNLVAALKDLGCDISLGAKTKPNDTNRYRIKIKENDFVYSDAYSNNETMSSYNYFSDSTSYTVTVQEAEEGCSWSWNQVKDTQITYTFTIYHYYDIKATVVDDKVTSGTVSDANGVINTSKTYAEVYKSQLDGKAGFPLEFNVNLPAYSACNVYIGGSTTPAAVLTEENGVATTTPFELTAGRITSSGDVKFEFSSYLKDVTVFSNNPSYGTIVIDGFTPVGNVYKLPTGKQVTLNPKPAEGCELFGWYITDKNGTTTFEKANGSKTITVTDKATYEAFFCKPGVDSVVAQKQGTDEYYLNSELSDALSNPNNANSTIVLIDNATLSQDTTIAENVTFLLPYQEGATTIDSPENENTPHSNSFVALESEANSTNTSILDTTTINVVLNIANNTTVDVGAGARLIVGGTIGSEVGGFSGQTCGSHSDIQLSDNSVINVESGGIISSCGYIRGGEINVESGGTVYEPFIIGDYCGGSYTVTSTMKKNNKVSAFNQYTMLNIQSKMNIAYGGSLLGYADLYTGAVSVSFINIPAQHNRTLVRYIASSNALITTKADATVSLTYDADKVSAPQTKVGHTTVNITGGAEFGMMSLKVTVMGTQYTVTTDSFVFGVPYNYRFNLNGAGSVYNITTDYKLFPGAEMYVGEGATLSLASNKTLQIYDGIQIKTYAATAYPSGQQLRAGGFSENAKLVVDGTFVVNDTTDANSPTTFTGIIQSNGETGVVRTGSNTVFSDTLIDGVINGEAYISSVVDVDRSNRTEKEAVGQIWDKSSNTLINLQSNTTYYATDGDMSVEKKYPASQYIEYEGLNTTATNKNYTYDVNNYPLIQGAWIVPKITFQCEDGCTADHTEENMTCTVEVGQIIQFPSCSKLGYEVDYWYNVDASSEVYEIGDKMPKKVITLKAHFKPIEYKITLNNPNNSIDWVWSDLSSEWEKVNDDTYDFVYTIEDVKEEKAILLPAPSTRVDGYTFGGWKIGENEAPNKNVTVQLKDIFGVTGANPNPVYTAYWDVESYNIVLHSNGGNLTGEEIIQNVPYGTGINLEGLASRDGYDLADWKVMRKEDDKWVIPEDAESAPATMPDMGDVGEELHLGAVWSAQKYPVIFNANGGSFATGITKESEVVYDSNLFNQLPQLSELTAPSGHHLNGWFTEAINGTQITEGDLYQTAGPSTYYAQWAPNSYTVTFDPNNATSGTAFERTYTYNAPDTERILPDNSGETNKFTRTGYTFAGWSTDPNASQTEFADGYINMVTDHNATVTLYAVWVPNTYTVTFNSNGGNGTMEAQTFTYDAKQALTTNAFTRPGYTFKGWAVSADSDVVKFTDGKEVPNLTATANGKITLYAVWTINQYNITFDSNGGTSVDTINENYNETINPPTEPTLKGHTFAGWFDGNNNEYFVKVEGVAQPIVMPEGGLALTARWTINQYSITFDYNGGSVEGNTSTEIIANYDEDVNAPTEPTREGYVFAGWVDASDKEYFAKVDGAAKVEKMPEDGLMLKANWTPINYTISFDSDGGSVVESITAGYETTVNEPTAPEKIGHTFLGWFEGETQYFTDGIMQMPLNGIELTAKWAVNTYKVTVFDEDGQTPLTEKPYEFAYGTDVMVPIPVKEGYLFTGWTPGLPTVMPAEDITARANWQIQKFTITFDSDGGTEVTSITEDYNTEISAPPVPTKEGHTFVGWFEYNSVGGVTQYFADNAKINMPAKNLALKAEWTINQYEIIFDCNGGATTSNINIKDDYDKDVSAPEEPTREGYTFVGWFDGDGKEYFAKVDGVAKTEKIPAKDLELTAKWQVNKYNLILVNEGQQITLADIAYGTVLDKNLITIINPVKTGYTFDGWFTADDKEVLGLTSQVTMPAADLTVSARYTANPYTVEFVPNGGTYPEGTEKAIQGFVYDAEQALDANAFTRPGYTFAGWALSEKGTVVYEDNATVKNLVTGAAGDDAITLYAVWTANDYNVCFNANDGEGTMDVQTFTYDAEAKALTANAFTRTGYTFAGWALSENGEVTYADKAEVSNLATEGEVTLYAVWTANTYDVLFDANKGEGTMEAQEFTYDAEAKELTANAFTRTGYTFAGWALSEEGEVTYTDKAEVSNLATEGEVTLYAVWTADTYDITLYHEDGTDKTEVITVTFDQLYSYGTNGNNGLEILKRTGYTFLGWYTGETADDKDGVLIDPAADKVTTTTPPAKLFARWQAMDYKISYTGVDATNTVQLPQGYNSDQVEEGFTLVNPTRTGYTFTGWTTEGVTTPVLTYTIPEGTTGDLSFEAHWTPVTYTITYICPDGTMPADPVSEYTIEQAKELPVPERTGYNFLAWQDELTGEYFKEIKVGTYGNLKLTAIWGAKTYIVTLNANAEGATVDGAATKDVTVHYDLPYGDKLVTPQYTGYIFDGWFTESVGGTEVKAADIVKLEAGQTLYAHWTPVTYTVVFDANGKTSDMPENKSCLYDKSYELPEGVPQSTGYTFVKWSTKADGTDTVENIFNLAATAADVKLYAIWSIDNYTITYENVNVEGVTNTEELTQNPDGYTVEDSSVTLVEPERTGYYFDGWTEKDASETVTTVGGGETGNMTLVANWTARQYTVTLDAGNGATVDTEQTLDIIVTFDSPYGTYSVGEDTYTELPVPTRTGYTFQGWYYEAQGNEYVPVGDMDSSVTSGTTVKVADNDTLYAHWSPISYSVAFDGVLDGVTGLPANMEACLYDQTYALPGAVPTLPGYTFQGWSLASGGTTAVEEIKNLADSFADEGGLKVVTLYAIWDAKEYTITFNSDGGSSVESITADYKETVEAPKAPTKTGYTFAGWFAGDVQYFRDDASVVMPIDGLALTAKWNINSYDVILVDEDGETSLGTYTFEYNADVAVEAPVREGYTFTGWNPVLPKKMPAEDVNAEATWKINEYTVTFNSDGGSDVDSITADYKEEVEAPKAPTKTGYTFAGWFAGEEQYFKDGESMKMPAKDLALTAVWNINQYTISFDTKGGNAIPAITQNFASDVTEPAVPEREGYTFAGWSMEIPTTMPAENITITASWTPIDYQMTFNSNGGNEVAAIIQGYETEVTAPAAPEREGYTFEGWFAEDGTQYFANGKKEKMPLNGITLTAKWDAKEYTVTFRSQGTQYAQFKVDCDAPIQIPEVPTRDGYTFAYWYASVNGSQVKYFVEDGPSTMPAKNLTLYAEWRANTYSVQFFANDGTDAAVVQDGFTYEVNKNLMANTFVREGYTFKGWKFAADDTGVAYRDSASVSTLSKVDGDVVKLYAHWEVNQYKITLQLWDEITGTRENYKFESDEIWEAKDVNGRSQAAFEADYNSEVPAPPSPTRTGYNFEGWYTTATFDEGTAFTFNADTKMIAQNLTLYANWSLKDCVITYGNVEECVEGGVPAPIEAKYGTLITAPTDPVREGYTFKGWYTDEACSTGKQFVFGENTKMPESMTIYAKWAINSYTVSFANTGDIKVDSFKAEYKSEVAKPEARPTKAGYVFSHWSLTEDGEAVTFPVVVPAKDITIYAVYDSYLEMLLAIDVEDGTIDFAGEGELELARKYFSVLNEEQKESYMGTEHQQRLYEVVQKISIAELRRSVKAAEAGTNDILGAVEVDAENGITVNLAEMTIHDENFEADPPILEGMIIEDQYAAINMLNVEFLTELFAFEDIKRIVTDDDLIPDEEPKEYELTGKTIASSGTLESDQFNLMLIVAWAALQPDAGKEEFMNYLQSQMTTLKIEALDGTALWATLKAETPEGIPYEVTYRVEFYSETHDLIYDFDGGNISGEYPVEAKYQSEVTLVDPVKRGYTFKGWTSEEVTINDDTFTMGKTDVNLKATWEMNKYEVSLDLGDGKLIDALASTWADNKVTYDVTTTSIVLPTKNQVVSPAGYEFGGWYVSNEEAATENVTLNPSETTFALGDIEYKALWIPVEYTLTINLSDGNLKDGEGEGWTETEGVYTRTFTVESKDVTLPELERYGYEFDGWDKELPTVMPANDLTVTAQWKAKEVKVTLYHNDETDNTTNTTVTFDGTFGSLPNPPERDGYGFDGWFTKAEGGDKYDGTVNVTSTDDVKLYAHWTAGSFNIIYAGMEDAVNHTDNPSSYVVDTEVELKAPEKTGYTFTGWTGECVEVKDGKYFIIMGTTGTQTVTANWQINQYTITFDSKGGSPVEAITQNYGTAVEEPEAPTREGYTFAGWSQDVPAVMPAENVELTAKWNINSHSITFVGNDGTVLAVKTYEYGEEMQTEAAPDVEGYTFAGWFDAEGTPFFEEEDGVVQTETMPDHDITVVAEYTINQYTFSFDSDCDIEVADITADFGATVEAPAEPSKAGHTFAGWFDKDGKEYFKKDAEGAAASEVVPAADVELTAKWNVNQYSIVFMNGEEVFLTITADYGDAVGNPGQPAKTGYSFGGWDGEVPTVMPAENLTFHATWEANEYSVTFNGNGALAATLPEAMNGLLYDQTYELPESRPVRTGYTFKGWSLQQENGTVLDKIYNLSASNNAAITLYAQWEADKFVVTLDAAGGTVAPGSIVVTYDGTYAELPTPEREGYTFNGWTDGTTTYTTASAVKITENQTLTAQWTEKGDTPYKVVHHLQNVVGDEYVADKEVEFTGKTNGTANATSESYTGFQVNAEKSEMSGTIEADGSLVLNVYYDRIQYQITWNVAGTSVPQLYRYGAMPEFIGIKDYQDDHGSYTFIGWDKELQMVDAEAVYTAKYDVDYVASIGDVTYATLEKAIEKAKSGETVRLDKDITLEEDLTIPAGVNLLLPCIDDDWGYNAVDKGKLQFNHDGTNTAGGQGMGPDAKLYRTMNIPEGVTLTVNGNVMVNSVSGRPVGGTAEMDITGGYAQINLDGKIVVNSGGNVDCFGFIKGSGSVTAENGATVGDLYIVRNWRGGTQAFAMYQSLVHYGDPNDPDTRQVYPMNEYDCHNIETDVIIKYGASYDGLVKMCANAGDGNAYYHTRFPQVNATNGMIRPTTPDSYVVRSYDPEADYETYTIYGGANFAESSLNISGVNLSTKDFVYPMDGDIYFVLNDGDYHFENDFKFLPGGGITVNSGATLTVDYRVYVSFYDEFYDVKNTGDTQYPVRDGAVLTIKEGAKFINKGQFGGSIVTESPDILIGDYPTWGMTTLEANGYTNGTVKLFHDLFITREGYDWRYGDPALGEVKDSIIWIGADYTELNAALETVPADLKIYADETVEPLEDVIDEIIFGLGKDKQNQVDEWTRLVLKYVEELKLRVTKVNLAPNGGTCDKDSISVTYGDTYAELPDPEYYGYKFLGWYDADNMLVTNETVMKKLDAEITLTAKWEMIPADYTKVNEAIASIPADMTGYTEESVQAVYDAEDAVDITLGLAQQDKVDAMAKAILDAIDALERVQIQVTFDSNGGTAVDQTLTLRYGDKYPFADLPVPEREGFDFVAWYTAKDGGIEIKADTKVTSVTDVVLYAKWADNTITEPADYSAVEAAKAKVPENLAPYTAASVNRLNEAIAAVVPGLTIDRQADVDAWAAAIEAAIEGLTYKKITVYFDPAGGVCETKSVQVTYGTAPDKLPEASKEYSEFLGWYTAKEGGKKVEAAELASKLENVTLYAQYKLLPADYSRIEEVKTTIPEDLSCYSDETVKALEDALDQIEAGYTLDKQTVVDRWADELEDAIAGLAYRKMTMTYDAQGGKVSPKSTVVQYNDTISWLPTPDERTYYRFDGWFTKAEGGEEVTVGYLITNVADFSIYAHWTQVDADYTRVYEALAMIPEDVEIYYTEESVANLQKAIDAVEYGLDGSHQDQVDNWASEIKIAIQKLVGKSVKVTFDYNGGSKGIISRMVRYGATYGVLPNTTKEGASFMGWYTSLTGGVKVPNNALMLQIESHTLYARWSDEMADYSAVEAAIGRIPADMTDIIYTTESVERVNKAVDAVIYNLTMTEQDRVDAWAAEINAAVDALEKYQNKAEQAAPEAPEILSTSDNTIIVKTQDGCEYSLDGVNWQKSGEFTGIKDNVEYKVYARYAETKTHYASPASEPAIVEIVCNEDYVSDNCPSDHFVDVNLSEWYHLDMDFVLEEGYMKGMNSEYFAPMLSTSRAMFITILYRMSGEIVTAEELSQYTFKDVEKGSFYEDAVAWAAARGITTGFNASTYGPDVNITREQVIVMLYRYAEFYGFNRDMKVALMSADSEMISDWAVEGIEWANAVGMIKGITNENGEVFMAPQKECTRVEAAAFIHRFCDKYL